MNSNREKWIHRIFRHSWDAKLRSQWWDLVEILTQPSLYAFPRHEQVSEGSDKKQTRKSGNTISQNIRLFGIFPDAQGQLTPQSVVGSGQITNSCEILWLSLLPVKDPIQLKALMWPQYFHHYTSVSRRARAANSVFRGWMWPKIGFIQAFIYILVTYKYQKDRIKKKTRKNGDTIFPNHKFMRIFPGAQGQLTPQSAVGSGRISNSSEISCLS